MSLLDDLKDNFKKEIPFVKQVDLSKCPKFVTPNVVIKEIDLTTKVVPSYDGNIPIYLTEKIKLNKNDPYGIYYHAPVQELKDSENYKRENCYDVLMREIERLHIKCPCGAVCAGPVRGQLRCVELYKYFNSTREESDAIYEGGTNPIRCDQIRFYLWGNKIHLPKNLGIYTDRINEFRAIKRIIGICKFSYDYYKYDFDTEDTRQKIFLSIKSTLDAMVCEGALESYSINDLDILRFKFSRTCQHTMRISYDEIVDISEKLEKIFK